MPRCGLFRPDPGPGLGRVSGLVGREELPLAYGRVGLGMVREER